MNSHHGFTIIELIVVIAIIAVLAAIVLSNVTQYNSKGKDAAIKEQVRQMGIAAMDHYATNGTYTGMCDAGTKCGQIIANIAKLGGTAHVPYINASGSAYCMDFSLNSGASWCIDHTGYSGSLDNCDGSLLHYSCQ